MIREIFYTIAVLVLSISAFSQAKKPTIMVVPSDNWCIKNGYTQMFDEMGTLKTLPDYKLALQNETDLLMTISKINTMMADRGFPLVNLESVLRNMEQESAEIAMLTSKSGGGISESPIDILQRTANADIIMQLTYVINQVGPQRSITFMLQGLDAYTNKQIAGAQGTGEPSLATETPVLLEEAVLSHIDNFNSRLQDHFNDLFENGREVAFQTRIWDTSMLDFEEEFDYNGETLELGEIIEDWVYENTVEGRYSTSTYTENVIRFDQVRIPLYDDRGRANDTRRWMRDLRSMMGKAPFNQECKIYTRGLGEVWLIVGEK
ncbi:DUF6175 family protein [uncultured Draconibacterium sp.]|uniref:DUF6175 family protein n=1 Tax=uncultured Draconibacterium sp. TaxID=1573823 RepID=UPI003217A25B